MEDQEEVVPTLRSIISRWLASSSFLVGSSASWEIAAESASESALEVEDDFSGFSLVAEERNLAVGGCNGSCCRIRKGRGLNLGLGWEECKTRHGMMRDRLIMVCWWGVDTW